MFRSNDRPIGIPRRSSVVVKPAVIDETLEQFADEALRIQADDEPLLSEKLGEKINKVKNSAEELEAPTSYADYQARLAASYERFQAEQESMAHRPKMSFYRETENAPSFRPPEVQAETQEKEMLKQPFFAAAESGNDWVYGKEKFYWWMAFAISLPLYIALIGSLVVFATTNPMSFFTALFYVPFFLAFVFISQAMALGYFRGNAIRVTPQQFPEVYEAAEKSAMKIGLKSMPALYVLESGGMLNAFATRLLFKNVVILYSDIMELAYEEGMSALEFVVAHELAHVYRKHTYGKWLIGPAMFFPMLALTYYRACEYTCDRIAAHCVPEGALKGMAVLAAGKQLYRRLNIDMCLHVARQERGLFTKLSEIYSTHPHLMNRIEKLLALPVVQKARQLSET